MLGELAIATGSDPQQSDERAPHYVDAAESGSRGHMLEACIRPFELAARRLHAHLKHVLGWRRANLSSKYALEVSHAHLARRIGRRHPEGFMPARRAYLRQSQNPHHLSFALVVR